MALQKCDVVLNVFNVDILVYEDKQAKDISLHWNSGEIFVQNSSSLINSLLQLFSRELVNKDFDWLQIITSSPKRHLGFLHH